MKSNIVVLFSNKMITLILGLILTVGTCGLVAEEQSDQENLERTANAIRYILSGLEKSGMYLITEFEHSCKEIEEVMDRLQQGHEIPSEQVSEGINKCEKAYETLLQLTERDKKILGAIFLKIAKIRTLESGDHNNEIGRLRIKELEGEIQYVKQELESALINFKKDCEEHFSFYKDILEQIKKREEAIKDIL